jgi:hypothetical protein
MAMISHTTVKANILIYLTGKIEKNTDKGTQIEHEVLAKNGKQNYYLNDDPDSNLLETY